MFNLTMQPESPTLSSCACIVLVSLLSILMFGAEVVQLTERCIL